MENAERFSKVFQLFVDSPSETVPKEELYNLFSHSGFSLTDESLENLKNKCPENGLPFNEYLIQCEELEKEEISREELQKCLESLCPDNSGFLDANTLINTLSTGKYSLGENELEEMLRLINPDANGKVSIVYLLSLIYNKN
ncbi:hypothetical protein NCER_100397 [Vairimorpha ceranae BRL01]|uniref:Calmodulin n=2 Tax=Vairimorpha ceranae TaxID=40302 RepID=C4V7G8_VAIC1|nr:calmodulin [Vairimorpha ceranae]EEQ82824.1 hypothetical protein NCER_100397 [Vairimorpha ceranae BRL01]KKO75062.1 calmodulin [Vairimorpha ceranae]